MYDRIYSSNNQSRIYLREDLYYKIIDEDAGYESRKNQFTYLLSNQAYEIRPKPEACSYLTTTHNFRTDGIVIGSNIETHRFMLNDLGLILLKNMKKKID